MIFFLESFVVVISPVALAPRAVWPGTFKVEARQGPVASPAPGGWGESIIETD